MIGFNDWRQMVANLDLVHNKLIMRDSQPATHVPYHEELGANATTDLGREMEPDEEFQEVEEQIDISEPSQAPHEDRHYPREPRPSTNSSGSSSRASASSSSALPLYPEIPSSSSSSSSSALPLHSEVPSTSSSSSSASLPLYSVIPLSSSSSSSSSSSKPSIKPIPRKKPRFKTIKRVHFVTDTSDKEDVDMENHQDLTAPVTYFVGAVNSIRLKQREMIPARTVKRVQIKTPLQTRLDKGKDYIFTPKRSASGVQ